MATNVSATAFFSQNPLLGSLCLGIAAICAAADAAIGEPSESNVQEKIIDALGTLLKKHSTLEGALTALMAEQEMHEFVSRERTEALLAAIRKHETDSSALISENIELTGQVGIWIEKWCVDHSVTIEQLSNDLNGAAIRFTIQLDRLETKVDQAEARSAFADAETHRLLNELRDLHPSEDYDGEIDAAKERLTDGRYDEAIALLDRLRTRAWQRLNDRQRFRVLANIGHAYDGKDDFIKAAEFFLKVTPLQPDDAHARCLECVALAYRNDPSAAQLASTLRQKYPESALAQAIWLRQQPQDTPFDQLLQATPDALRADAEVAITLSHRAMVNKRFAEAEQYARIAVKDAPTNPRVKFHLGGVLVDCERQHVVWIDGTRPVVSDDTRLREAITLLTQASEALGHSAGSKTVSIIRRARGLAYALLDENDKAERDFQIAYDVDPTDPASSLDYALVQAERGPGGVDQAIRVLSQAENTSESSYHGIVLARLLAKRNCGDDVQRAIGLLRAGITSASTWSPNLRNESVGLLVEVLGSLKDHQGAADVLAKLPDSFLTAPAKLALEARAALAAGDHAQSADAALKARSSLSPTSTAAEKRLVAETLLVLQLNAEALPLWREIVTPRHFGRDATRLLETARRCGDDATILDFCRSLRGNGYHEPQCLDLEAATLGKYHGFNEAIAVLQDYLARGPEDEEAKLARLRLSAFGIEMNRADIIETDPSRLPDVYSASAQVGEAVTHVLSHGPDPFTAVEYAYALVRRHFKSPAAHRALIRAFLFGTTRKPVIPVSECIVEGFAAIYRIHGADRLDGLVIEDSTTPPPSFELQEIAPKDGRAAELRGKRVGETFFLRRNEIQNIEATIVEIVHKTVFRMRDSLEHFEERFKDDFVVSVSIPKQEDGSMDFTPIFRSVDQRHRAVTNVEKLLRDHRLPVTAFAVMLGSPVLPAMEHVASQPTLSIWTNIGSDEELKQAFSWLSSGVEVVLAPSAIATLRITRTYRSLVYLPFKLVVSHGTLSEYRRLYADAMAESEEGGIIAKIQDHHVFVPNERAHIEQRRADLKDLLDWLVQNCEVVDGTPLAYVLPNDRDMLINLFGRACAESAALARDGKRLLWDDDLGVGAVSQSIATKRVWTQGVMCWLVGNQRLGQDEYHRLTTELLRFGYRFTRINAQTIRYVLTISNWNTDDPAVVGVLSALADLSANPESVLRVTVDALRMMWTIGPDQAKRLAATQALLTHLDRRAGGRQIVRMILHNIQTVTHATPGFVLYLRWYLESWLNTGSVDNLSWIIFGPTRNWTSEVI